MANRVNKFDFPEGMDRFNWGAFFLGWVWAAAMESVTGVLLSIFLGFVGNLIIGFRGNKMAWQAREFKDLEDFIWIQEEWTRWGLIVFIITFSVSIIATIVSLFFIYKMTGTASRLFPN